MDFLEIGEHDGAPIFAIAPEVVLPIERVRETIALGECIGEQLSAFFESARLLGEIPEKTTERAPVDLFENFTR